MPKKNIFRDAINIKDAGIRKFFMEIPFPVEIYNSSGVLEFSNKTFMEAFGILAEDLMTGRYNILLDKMWSEYGVVNEIKGAFGGELNFIRDLKISVENFRNNSSTFKKGEVIFNLTLFPLYDTFGKISLVIAFWHDATKIKNKEYQLNLLTTALESAANGIVITDKDGAIKWVNKAFSAFTGYSKEELFGKNPRILKSGIQDDDFYKTLWDTILKGEIWRGEIVNRKKDGSLYSELQTITPVKNSAGEIENFIAIKIDISERIKAENELNKLNRELTTISACNSILIHSTDEKALLNEICRVIIETGGYSFAWIGLIDDQLSKYVTPAAKYGHEENYLEINENSLKHKTGELSPLYKAVQFQKIQVVNDIFSNKSFTYWKDEALKRGYHSVIALPLIFNETSLGALCIYSDIKNSFDLPEIDLLQELADDLSYGINSLRMNEKRKIAEVELAKSEEQYRLFFKGDVAGDYISTADGRIIDCNDAFLNIFGFKSIDEARGFNAYNLHPKPENRKAIFEIIKREKSVKGLELELKTVDGRTVNCIENAWGTFDEEGNITAVKGYMFDITKRKAAETLLKESELKFQELVENINDVFYTGDLNGIITYISPAISIFGGYNAKEVVGRNFNEFIYEPDREKIWNNFNSTIKGHSAPEEFRIMTKEGDVKWVRSSGKPLIRNGKTVGVQGVLFDITQIKETERKLEEAKAKAEESDRLKSAFLAQMSHEIRTPLNVILSYNYLLRDELKEKISDEWYSIFDSMELAGKRLLRTIDLILNMSVVQTGQLEINKSSFELSEIISHTVKELMKFGEDKKIELLVNNKVEDSTTESDDYVVSQIFENLIDNAIKYTNYGKVEVTIYRNESSELCVDVSDTGIGISKEYLPRLFSPFSQEDIGYSRKFEGNGLGLALVKNYADLLNIELKVESEKGKGTTFTVVFKSGNFAGAGS